MPQAITVAVKDDLPQSQEKEKTNRHPSKGVTSHWANIATSWSLVTLPITALTVAFLVMVFQYRVTHDDIPFENLRSSSLELKDENNVIYVDLNSSVILFVTSWASSLAPMLTGFIMALASFPIARQLSNTIRNGCTDSLPTPYQFGLTLKFLDGSALAAIWFWMVYLISWERRENHKRQYS
ncbi:hypothetical protein N7450_007933 [Penicillium hetheringtonii]|uniref:Uncharacterized protein n=1 Tax=Penicillium hetheringtonii TaxID=911720 RepID=A0AAD6GQU6_9EURO|nr:hypothetical protein N7450_007933 [Penicillium hetheringtonii]